jgi:uncharacterized surface protein with fasciclin (FAS1) repeats
MYRLLRSSLATLSATINSIPPLICNEIAMRSTALFLSLVTAGVLHAAATLKPVHAADVVDTAVAAGSFETLATALTKVKLVDALKGDGPFTVFAPTESSTG